jgi:hypothetical protein
MNHLEFRLRVPDEGHVPGQLGGGIHQNAVAHQFARLGVYVFIFLLLVILAFNSGSHLIFYLCCFALVFSLFSLCAGRLLSRIAEAALARQQLRHIPLNEIGADPLPVPNMAQASFSPFHSLRVSPNRFALGDLLLLQRALLANREFSHADFDALLALDQRNSVPQSRITPPEVVAQFPTYPFQCRNGAAPIECPICLENLQANQIVRALPCCHSFHVQCIGPWLSSNHTCPVCKHNLLPEAQ